jgi:invasion protein IalB
MKSRFTGLAVGLMAGMCLAGAAQAQSQEVREDFEKWQVYCPPAKAGEKQDCEIHQLLKNKQGKLVAGMYGTRQSNNTLLMVRVPLGVLLNKNMTLQIDGGIGTDAITFIRCDNAGCIAQILTSETFLNALRKGDQAKLTVYADANKALPISFDLSGFSEAEQALIKRAN